MFGRPCADPQVLGNELGVRTLQEESERQNDRRHIDEGRSLSFCRKTSRCAEALLATVEEALSRTEKGRDVQRQTAELRARYGLFTKREQEIEWSRLPEPYPTQAGYWCSRFARRPNVRLIWCGNGQIMEIGLRPWMPQQPTELSG
jgi:hypothetical protein